MMSALPLASAKPYLDGDLCSFFFDFHISSFFSGFQLRFCHIHWLHPYRSSKHRNWWRFKLGDTFLIQTYNIILLILYSNLMKNVASLTILVRFNYAFWEWLTFWVTLKTICRFNFYQIFIFANCNCCYGSDWNNVTCFLHIDYMAMKRL